MKMNVEPYKHKYIKFNLQIDLCYFTTYNSCAVFLSHSWLFYLLLYFYFIFVFSHAFPLLVYLTAFCFINFAVIRVCVEKFASLFFGVSFDKHRNGYLRWNKICWRRHEISIFVKYIY